MDALDKLKRRAKGKPKGTIDNIIAGALISKEKKKKRSSTLSNKSPYLSSDQSYSLGIQPYASKNDEDESDVELKESAPRTRRSKLEKIQQLIEANAALKLKLVEHKQDIKSLTKQCRDIQRSSTIQLSALEMQLEDANAELEKSKSKAKNFSEPTAEQIDGRLLAIQALKDATQKQENRIVRLKGDLERRRYQARAKDERLRELEKEITELKDERSSLREKFEANQLELNSLQRDLTDAIKQVQKWETDQRNWDLERKDMLVQLRESQTDLMKERSLRSVEMIETKGEETNLQGKLVEKIETIAKLESIVEKLKGEITEEREMNSKKEIKMRSDFEMEIREGYEKKLKQKDEDIETLREEKSSILKQSEKFRLDNEGLNVRINWLVEDSDRLRKKLDENTKSFGKEKDRMQKELTDKGESTKLAVQAANSSVEKERAKHVAELEHRIKAANDMEKAIATAIEREKAVHKKELEASVSVATASAREAAVTAAEERASLRSDYEHRLDQAKSTAKADAEAIEKELISLRKELEETKKSSENENKRLQKEMGEKITIAIAAKEAAESVSANANVSIKKSVENIGTQTAPINFADEKETPEIIKELSCQSTQTSEESYPESSIPNKVVTSIGVQTSTSPTKDVSTATVNTPLEHVSTQTPLSEKTETGTQSEEKAEEKVDVPASEGGSKDQKQDYETLEAELNQLRTWAKAALKNVQRLEDAKASAKAKNDELERRLTEMESRMGFQDDLSSVGSNTLANFIRDNVDDDITISSAFEMDDSSLASSTNRRGKGMRRFFRRGKGASVENGEYGDKSITVSEDEIIYKDEKIKHLQKVRQKHEKTLASLVKEIIKLRGVKKENDLQIEDLQHEREAFKMKIAVLEKEFAILDINTKADTQSDIAAKFQQASRGQSDFVAETAATVELRAKSEKISALEKLISEDKQVITSLQSEMDSLRIEAKKESQKLREDIEKLRRENIMFFQQVKQLEKEQQEDDDSDNEKDDLDESGSESLAASTDSKSQEPTIIRDLKKKIKDRDGKISALKRYNEMMEKTVAQVRKEYVELRTTLRTESKDSKMQIERLTRERDSETSKVSALEKQFIEINRIQEDERANGNGEGSDSSIDLSQANEGIKILKMQISNVKYNKNKEIETLKEEIEKIGLEKKDLEKEVTHHLAEIDDAKLRINSTSGELTFIKSQLESVEEEKMLMEEDLQNKLDLNEGKVRELETTLLKLRESHLDQHQKHLKKKKKKKKKKKIVDPSILEKKYNNKDADAAALLEQMFVDDIIDNFQDKLNSDTESEYTLASESEFESETDSESLDGSIGYHSKQVGLGRLLPRERSDEVDDSFLPYPTQNKDRSRPSKLLNKSLLADNEDEDNVFDGLPIQPDEIPEDRWL